MSLPTPTKQQYARRFGQLFAGCALIEVPASMVAAWTWLAEIRMKKKALRYLGTPVPPLDDHKPRSPPPPSLIPQSFPRYYAPADRSSSLCYTRDNARPNHADVQTHMRGAPANGDGSCGGCATAHGITAYGMAGIIRHPFHLGKGVPCSATMSDGRLSGSIGS